MKIEKNYEWQSILDLSGKGLKQFNAVDQGLNATQLLNNAGLRLDCNNEASIFSKFK
jgi:hypothetical protein